MGPWVVVTTTRPVVPGSVEYTWDICEDGGGDGFGFYPDGGRRDGSGEGGSIDVFLFEIARYCSLL